MSEQQLHIAVMRFLDLALPKEAVAWHTPNGGSRNVIEAAKLKRMGTRAGFPDVAILYRGKLLCIELKRDAKAKTSAKQDAMMNRLMMAGATTCVCRSLEGVEQFLKMLQIPLTARAA